MLGMRAVILISALALGWTTLAKADECENSSDCPKGFTCEESVAPELCPPVPPCAPGAKCPDSPPCVTTTSHACQPATCQSDSDCGDGMVCFTQHSTSCSGGVAVAACPVGQKCPVIPETPPVCMDQTTQLCTPKYLLPCAQDSDCGAGFNCLAEQVCTCWASAGSAAAGGGSSASSPGAGSAPTPASDGGSAKLPIAPLPAIADAGAPLPPVDAGAPPPPSGCDCQDSPDKSCQLQDIDCTTDSDCPAGLKCLDDEANTVAVSCGPAQADAGPCAAVAPVPEKSKRCQSPYASTGVYRSALTSNASASSGGSAKDTAQGIIPPTTANVAPTGSPTPATAAPTTETADHADSNGTVNTQSGSCSVVAPGARSGGSMLALLAIAFSLVGRHRMRRRSPR
jgi:hypothetical protein